jgi:hypothetical protein
MRDGRARTAVELIKTPEIAECYLNFFSNIRYNPPLLRRLEKDLMWRDIDEIIRTMREYDSFKYEGIDDDKYRQPVLIWLPPAKPIFQQSS